MRIVSKGDHVASLDARRSFNAFIVFFLAGFLMSGARPVRAAEEIGQVNAAGMFTIGGENWQQASPFKIAAIDFAYPLTGIAAAGPSKPKSPGVALMFASVADPQIFGTVSIAVSHLAVEARWRAIAPIAPRKLFGAICNGDRDLCDSPLMHAWARLRASLSDKTVSPLEILHRVNAEVNAGIRYRSDTDNYGVPDYWASPAEVARRHSADCKEFALVKMWMLAALGVPNASMRIVVVKDLENGDGHAILSVSLGHVNLVLDNLTSHVRDDRMIARYQPLYSVSTTGSWIHGVRHSQAISQLETKSQVADAAMGGDDLRSD
jgi:predicted transglutaminase-like cysteine proteinase